MSWPTAFAVVGVAWAAVAGLLIFALFGGVSWEHEYGLPGPGEQPE